MASPVEEKGVAFDELNQTCADVGSIEDEMVPKVRKPYTITKQREKWTEEEHQKFLNALQLYGRAWRRIEEHIGTKTTVQIRSHAQKFFSKVTKESLSGQSIEIPPPRPKRKPMHPYPRKLGNQNTKNAPALNQLEKPLENQFSGSPTSVLSTIGSENQNGSKSPLESSASGSNYADSRSQSATATSADEHLRTDPEVPVTESDQDAAQAPSIKLFGKTVVLSVAHSNENAKNKNEAAESDMKREEEQWTGGADPFVYYVPWWSWPYPFINPIAGNFGQEHEEEEHEKEGSWTGSSTDASEVVDENSEGGEREEEDVAISSNKKEDNKPLRGFVPYKKRKVEAGKEGEVKLGL